MATHSKNEPQKRDFPGQKVTTVLVDLVDNFEFGGASFLSRTRWHNESRQTKSF